MDPLDDFDLVIFDCDGVVVDSEILSCGCLAESFRAYGIPCTLDEAIDRFVGRSVAAVEAYWQNELQRDPPPGFFPDHRERVAAAFAARLEAMPGACDVLAKLPHPFCLASSSEPDRIRLSLSLTRLDGYFSDRVFSAAMVANGKPAPDLFLLAARAMNQRPERALVVEDSISGVRAGKAAGDDRLGLHRRQPLQGRETAG